ncbi:MAG: sialidase family protein, partial [Planctomycetota bacterium]
YQIRNPSTTGATAYNNGRNMVMDSMGNLIMVYRDRTSPYHIFVKKSDDMGKSWTPSTAQDGIRVSTSAQTYNLYPSIAIDSQDTLHVVWGADVSGNSYDSVFYSNSTDGGLTWTNPVAIFNGGRRTFSGGYDYRYGYVPSIAVDSNDVVHVVWELYRYFYRRSPYTRFYNRGIQHISIILPLFTVHCDRQQEQCACSLVWRLSNNFLQ